jgi:ribosomal-protein-alanine N-acetyltransferase
MMMPPEWRPPNLATPRLVLRPFTEADAETVFAHAKNPNVTRFTLWDHHKSLADSLAFVHDYALHRYREGTPEPYAITIATDVANPIGACGCFWTSHPNRTMELGYWIAEPFWGQGIAVEACRVLLNYVFADIQPERIQARVIVGNDASRRVLDKLGFCHEGTLRRALLRRDEFEDVMMYAVLRNEWAE